MRITCICMHIYIIIQYLWLRSEIYYSTSRTSNNCDFNTSRDWFLNLTMQGCNVCPKCNIIKFKLKGLKNCVTDVGLCFVSNYVVVNWFTERVITTVVVKAIFVVVTTIFVVVMAAQLKEHVALDRTSWSIKSVWNRLLWNAYG